MLTLGEVHTGLLQNSTSVSQARSLQLLALVLGERVRQSARPIAYAVSPDRLTGVDCRLATVSKARVRGVGTVVSRAAITGGHVLQGSTFARVVKGEADRRLPWSHYMSQPGVVETVGKADQEDLANGFTETKPGGGGWGAGRTPALPNLDLGAVSDRMMDEVQVADGLDRKPPFRMARTRLRWVVAHGTSSAHGTSPAHGGRGAKAGGGTSARIRFSIDNDTLRTTAIEVDVDDPRSIAAFCEDLALHDWLLTTLLDIVERSRIGDGSRERVIDRLRPAIDYLLHLWMPAARVDEAVLPLWESLERRPGFTKQWRALVDRIRDQVAVGTVAQLSAVGGWAE
jgi:hypothetical protein